MTLCLGWSWWSGPFCEDGTQWNRVWRHAADLWGVQCDEGRARNVTSRDGWCKPANQIVYLITYERQVMLGLQTNSCLGQRFSFSSVEAEFACHCDLCLVRTSGIVFAKRLYFDIKHWIVHYLLCCFNEVGQITRINRINNLHLTLEVFSQTTLAHFQRIENW